DGFRLDHRIGNTGRDLQQPGGSRRLSGYAGKGGGSRMTLILVIGLATGCVYAIVAGGYFLEYRPARVGNFSEGNYVMLGGFSTYWFYTKLGMLYPLAICSGIALTTLAGLMLWAFVVLPLWRRRSPPYVVLLGTIVFGALLSILALLALGP